MRPFNANEWNQSRPEHMEFLQPDGAAASHHGDRQRNRSKRWTRTRLFCTRATATSARSRMRSCSRRSRDRLRAPSIPRSFKRTAASTTIPRTRTWRLTCSGPGHFVLPGGFLDPSAASYRVDPDPNYWGKNASAKETWTISSNLPRLQSKSTSRATPRSGQRHENRQGDGFFRSPTSGRLRSTA